MKVPTFSSEIESGNFLLTFLEEGRELKLTVEQPQCLTKHYILHKKWLLSAGPEHIESFYSMFTAFKAALKCYRVFEVNKV